MSVNDTINQDLNASPLPAQDSVRQQYNLLLKFVNYFLLNRPAWQVAAAAVAPPVCATATTKSKVKTTATSQLWVAGVVKSLTATDDFWTLTGDSLAAGYVRRYALLWSGASATTVMSVQASDDQSIAEAGSSALALAACRWSTPIPPTVTCVGILSIVNTTNAFVPGTTLLDATGVTATYVDGPDANVIVASLLGLG